MYMMCCHHSIVNGHLFNHSSFSRSSVSYSIFWVPFLPAAWQVPQRCHGARDEHGCQSCIGSGTFTHTNSPLPLTNLQKGIRGLYRQWNPHDIDLATTLLQISHPMGGYGMTPNAIAQISTKVAMASRFLGLISSLPREQILLMNKFVAFCRNNRIFCRNNRIRDFCAGFRNRVTRRIL